jgi:choline-sulfatase
VPRPPDILFLMSDQHRPDVAGYEGNPVVRTPVLDGVARTGVVFRNAYCPSPICVPGRMAMMAGQLPRTCGCERWGQDLPPGAMTFARRFSQYAYQTIACGKLHHMGTDQLQGWNRLIGMHENLDAQYIEGRHEPSFERFVRGPDGKLKWSPVKEVLRAGLGRARPSVHDEFAMLGARNVIDQYFVDARYVNAGY